MIMWQLIYGILLSSILCLGLGNERAKLYLFRFSEPWVPVSWMKFSQVFPAPSSKHSACLAPRLEGKIVSLLLLVFLFLAAKHNYDK